MATKTISLELDAYEKLRRAKRDERESFSAVVRRAVWPAEYPTGPRLLQMVRERVATGESGIEEAALDRLDEVQRRPRRSRSKW
jgi:predicted nucleic acid-binding protein